MSEQGFKRKKKGKSFLCKMKKYHRKGSVGRGNRIDDDTYQYFLRMYEVQSKGFESQEDKVVFVNNFFEEIQGNEVDYSRNQIGSRLIEALLPTASSETIKKFTYAFDESLRPLCCDEFASHIIEALLKIAAVRSKAVSKSDDEEKETDDKETNWCKFFQGWVVKIGRFMLNNLEDFVWDTFANHIIRTVFACLVGGLDARGLKSCGQLVKAASDSSSENLDHKNLLKEFANRLMMWPQMTDLPFEELTSGLLQILLLALHKATSKSTLKIFLNTLIDNCFMKSSSSTLLFVDHEELKEDKGKLSNVDVPSIFESEPAVHLFEVMISVAPRKLFTQMYAKFCMNRLAVMSRKRSTNFIIQKLLQNCQEGAELESIFNELESHLTDILKAGHIGIIVSLCQASQRLAVKQGQILQIIMKILDCFEPKDRQIYIAPLLANLKSYDKYVEGKKEEKKSVINMHGCLILQSLLSFNKPILIVNSLLEMNVEELKDLFCDNKGSHIAEAFLRSQTVGSKSREKLIKTLMGSFASLASTKSGSWVFEAVWEAADLKQKVAIMEELIQSESILESTEFGRIIVNKVFVQTFRKNREAWVQAQNRDLKKKKLFEDIL